MAVTKTDSKWAGGYIRRGTDGELTYYLTKRKAGVRPHLPVGKSKAEAETELFAYLADPVAWMEARGPTPAPSGDDAPGEAPLYLTKPLIEEYADHCKHPRDNRKPNSQKWVSEKSADLEWWMTQLIDGDRRLLDLKKVSLADHVIPALEVEKEGKVVDIPGARHRRETIKAFYSWLRRRGKIRADQDPVRSLPVGPGGKPALATGKKRVPLPKDVDLVTKKMLSTHPRYGHALKVSAATGWHDTEISIFAKGGAVLPVPAHLKEPGVEALLFLPVHKKGKPHTVKVSADTAASARALVAPYEGKRAGLNIPNWVRLTTRYCKDVGVEVFHPAWLRHARSTKALQDKHGQEEIEALRKALGHEPDSKMLEQVYGYGAIGPYVPGLLDESPKAAKASSKRGAKEPTVRRAKR